MTQKTFNDLAKDLSGIIFNATDKAKTEYKTMYGEFSIENKDGVDMNYSITTYPLQDFDSEGLNNKSGDIIIYDDNGNPLKMNMSAANSKSWDLMSDGMQFISYAINKSCEILTGVKDDMYFIDHQLDEHQVPTVVALYNQCVISIQDLKYNFYDEYQFDIIPNNSSNSIN